MTNRPAMENRALWPFALPFAAGKAAAVILASLAFAGPAVAESSLTPAERLLKAYPDALERIDGNALVWRDGTRMEIDDGKGEKPIEAWIENPDLEDMFRFPYPAGAPADPPQRDVDPGRARNAAFFDKMYGACKAHPAPSALTTVTWLPKKDGHKLKVSNINGVDKKLTEVSQELDALPASFDVYLKPPAGTLNCRTIAGTDRMSTHGYGIAIDIALKHAHYWRNAKPGPDGQLTYQNAIPLEIVRIFEKHGFIWGGRWYHYDTMHFEYRPELLPLP